MTKDDMIAKIYEVVADKNETEWCICEFQLPIELSTNKIQYDWSLSCFVNSFFYEWVHMFYIKKVRLNWSVNIVDFDISELPPVFDKYKKYILRTNDQFFIRKISKPISSARSHNSVEWMYNEKWDWRHWEDYFSKYNPNSKEKYSVTYRDNVIDGRWHVHYDSECNSNIVNVIWHPVMIGDVLDWLEKDYTVDTKRIIPWFELDKKSSEDWKVSMIRMHYCEQLWFERAYKRKPIEHQSEECITFIYNLTISHVPKKENKN